MSDKKIKNTSVNDRIQLNDDSTMPQLGLGSFRLPVENIKAIMSTALEAGYRSFDTATYYGNEALLGQALKHLMPEHELDRESLYITSKIWPTCFNSPISAIEYSLKALNLDYLDSYYLHWPGTNGSDRYRAWEALLEYREKGHIKSVGVSNFTKDHLVDLIDRFGVRPVVNQIELHPWYPQTELAEWCRANHIEVSAWGPLFRGRIHKVLFISEIGQTYGKTPAQVTLRWHLQKGNIVIPKSANLARIKENTDLYDFTLSKADMLAIDSLICGEHFGDDPLTFDGGPFALPS